MPTAAATAFRAPDPLSYAAHLAQLPAGRTKGERTRVQLLIAACEALEESRPQDLTIASICAAAGVSNGTFYIYFPDRNALLGALLTGFTAFLQSSMREAVAHGREDPVRAATRAYFELFEQNRGLMRCLLHHLDSFPESLSAFRRLNREWVETVVASARRRLQREGREDAVAEAELLRRAYALGGMVDQYFSGLMLTDDPHLAEISKDREAVLETLNLIWERGMAI